MRRRSVVLGAAILTAALLAGRPAVPEEKGALVWWEGESAVETSFPDSSPFAASTFRAKRHLLSGGDWLTNAGPRRGPEAFARYDVRVPATGEYALWARKFWKHGPFRWRFDDDPWRSCGRDVALADSVSIRTHLGANWVHLGEVRLARGRHRFEIRLLAGPGEPQTAAFDCFVLSAEPFVPRGRLKPGETSGVTEDGWWAFEPDADPMDETALDLRSLNEAEAGASGRLTWQGSEIVRGDGTPVRLWGVNVGPDIVRQDRGSIRYLARRLARRGVNLVRVHGPIFDRSAADPAAVDTAMVEKIRVLAAECKAQGIYTSLSFYFPLWFDVRPTYGLPGYESTENKKPFGLLFFDERMQAIHRAWMKGLLAKESDVGPPLAKDPAVALLEIVNEDSLLFWTFKPGETIPWPRMEALERAFHDFLRKRHGSISRAESAWDGRADHPRDASGRMGLWPAWNLTEKGHGEGPRRRRASDQLRFLVETQQRFYAETYEHLRKRLGYDGLVVSSNWRTADARLLDPLEQWTCEGVIDRHGYFGGRHEGDGASYSVREGHRFADRAAVRHPAAFPMSTIQLRGRPQVVSEIGGTNPNRWRADFPVLVAATGAIQGVDAVCLFAGSGTGWAASARKFPYDVPSVLGQSPACGLIFRTWARDGDPVVREVLSTLDLHDFGGAAAVAPAALDALRQRDVPRGADGARGTIDPLAWIVGPIVRGFGKPSLRQDPILANRIDRAGKTVRSRDERLTWRYGEGLVLLDEPRFQGATGFLAAAGKTALGDVTIESGNEFGTLLAVALDGRPLARSERVLLQAMTEERPHGWRVEGDRIADLGGPPMMVRDVHATVTLRGGARFRRARVLDPRGVPRETLRPRKRGRDLIVRMPRDALYVLLD